MSDIDQNDLNSADALKLGSPRKTELREKKSVNYANLNKGTGLNNEEEDSEGQKLKKQNSKMQSYLEVQKKVQEIFDKLKSHEHASLFNKFLDKNHPCYAEV